MLMTVIITLDDKNGYTLFGKRLSRDREIIKDIEKDHSRIYASEYSAVLFRDSEIETVSPVPDPLPDEAILFLETDPVPEEADTLIVYRWNKKYPSDSKYNPEENGWKRISSTDFSGYSHEKLTKEVYIR